MHLLIPLAFIWAYFIWRRIKKSLAATQKAEQAAYAAQAIRAKEFEDVILAIKREELEALRRANGRKGSPLIGYIP